MARFVQQGSLSGLKDKSYLGSRGTPMIIGNSVAMIVGAAVNWASTGFIGLGTAGSRVLGICQGVVGINGERLTPDSNTTDTYTVASDNQTVAKKKVLIDSSKDTLWHNVANGAVNIQSDLDVFLDLTSATQLSSTAAANGAFKLLEVDPNLDATLTDVLVTVSESQFDPYAQV